MTDTPKQINAQFFDKNILLDDIEKLSVRQPIFSKKLAKTISEKTGIDFTDALNAVRRELANLADEGQLIQHGENLFSKIADTPFGPSHLSEQDVRMLRLLFDEEGEPIGYETGPSLMNAPGLSAQMPNKIFVASNNYQKINAECANIVVLQPKIFVTKENIKHLQLLDAIYYLNKTPVDAADPHALIRRLAEKNTLLVNDLVHIADIGYDPYTAQKVREIFQW